MSWEHGVIDATMGARDGMLCFCPVELDADGEITAIVTGMNFVGDPPPRMKIIAVVHDEGQDACEAFYAEHRALIDPFIGRDSGSGPEGGDAKQAPGEAPQSGRSEGEGIAPNPPEAA